MNAELSKNRLWLVRLLRMYAMKEADSATEVPDVIFYSQPMERQRQYRALAAWFSSDCGPSGFELLPTVRRKERRGRKRSDAARLFANKTRLALEFRCFLAEDPRRQSRPRQVQIHEFRKWLNERLKKIGAARLRPRGKDSLQYNKGRRKTSR
jgi:hypothetical protein